MKSRCPDCIAVDQEKDSRKLPRGQGWNAKRLREEGLAMGVDAMPAGADGMAGAMQVVGVVVGHDGIPIPSSPVPKKHAPGGIKKDNGAKRLHSGQPGSGGMSNELCKEGGLSGRLGLGIVGSEMWAVEKAQLVQENQQLRNEAEERRRAAAELEKARAEIERLVSLVFSLSYLLVTRVQRCMSLKIDVASSFFCALNLDLNLDLPRSCVVTLNALKPGNGRQH